MNKNLIPKRALCAFNDWLKKEYLDCTFSNSD